MYSFKSPSMFRPTSPPSTLLTPPDSPRARPLSRVPFNLRRSSMTPATSPCRTPLIQDGSYLEALGLRLNEAVSKALAHPSGPSLQSELVGGKRPIPAGRGRALGALIASELQAARDNSHLHKAILRALHKPLSVLLNNLSALLLPLLSSPAFLQSPAPALQMPISNAIQLHALSIADFAGELLSSFDDMALATDADSRGDGLKPIRAGLVSLIVRVVNPLISGIKEKLTPLVDALEASATTATHKVMESSHPSIIALQASVPLYSRALARYASTYTSHALLASFLISIVWRALVALSHRPTATSTPGQAVLTEKVPRIPSVTSHAGLFHLKRASSQPAPSVVTSTVAADAKALYEIFSHFPRPTHTQMAREAVDEAFVHLEALGSLLEIADQPFLEVNRSANEVSEELHGLTDNLPTLIALPVMLRMQYFRGIFGSGTTTVAALFNISEDAYRRNYLAGFGRAEQCGCLVAQQILDELYAQPVADPSECLVDWLEDRVGHNDH